MTKHPDDFDAYTADFSIPRPEYRDESIESTATLAEWRAFLNLPTDVIGTVDSEKAMQITAVFSAVDFISDQFAALPAQLFKDTPEGPVKAVNDPLYKLIHSVVNDNYMTSFQWRKTMCVCLLLNGRAFTHIERDRLGREKNFRVLEHNTVTPKMINGRLVYVEKTSTKEITHDAADIIDLVRTGKPDGVNCYNPIYQNRETLGLALAVEQFSATTFANGGVPPLQMVSTMDSSPGAKERSGKTVQDALRRAVAEKKHILPMPFGYRLEKIGHDPATMQLLELRKWLVVEIARIFKLPPAFLQDLTTGTYSNTEQQSQTLIKHTLGPIIQIFEQEMNSKCGVRKTYVKLNVNALVRGDFKTQMEGLRTAVFGGLMTPNEARGLLELPALPNGDQLMMQGATVPIDQLINSGNTDTVEGEAK